MSIKWEQALAEFARVIELADPQHLIRTAVAAAVKEALDVAADQLIEKVGHLRDTVGAHEAPDTAGLVLEMPDAPTEALPTSG